MISPFFVFVNNENKLFSAKMKWVVGAKVLWLTFLSRKVRKGGLERSSNIFTTK